MTVLGIDPGTTRVGYGLIEDEKGRLRHMRSGILSIPVGLSEQERLPIIENEIKKLIKETRPDRIGIERLFFTKNKKTAISVAQARGVLVNAALGYGIPVLERTPLEVKVAVTSDGKASKAAVALMVRRFLGLKNDRLLDDVTDALAVAIAVSNTVPGEV